MEPFQAAIERLRFAVRALPKVLARISESESEQRPAPERWAKKEVVGHLIDSASNNHQRFVRGQIQGGQDFPRYEQESWVRVQQYQAAPWKDLIDLWRTYNTHLVYVGACMSEEGRRAVCRVGGGSEVTLAALFVDYVDHLEQHLRKALGRWECAALRWDVHRVADMTTSERAALRELGLAVYPPEVAATWPGLAIEWSPPEWSVIARDDGGATLCHVGVVLRDARWNDRAVKVGGIGGVKTHPAFRRRGLAAEAIRRALDFLRARAEVDFALLVCEAALIPFYASLGWQTFPGELFVTQRRERARFTFDLPMTMPLERRDPLDGVIDLMGPPW